MKKEIREKIEKALGKAQEEAEGDPRHWFEGVEYVENMDAEFVFELLSVDWTEEGMKDLTEADIISAIFADEKKYTRKKCLSVITWSNG
jgi:hypothetical protein